MADATLLRHVRALLPTSEESATDIELLCRFASKREEAAFAELVRRHAGLVWGVCRRTLGHAADAEDAFQATFLVLARNARNVRKGESVAAYLFGVARRTALRARSKRNRSLPATTRPAGWDTASEVAVRELQAILDEEVDRLPAKYRTPIHAVHSR
jgi:RNA polymerase sigma factor (sigma-70 family)